MAIEQLQPVLQHYSPLDDRRVDAFLRKHPFLVSVLIDAVPQIERVFGAIKHLKLELTHDPETVDDEGRLFIRIPTRLSWQEALGKLDSLDDSWWLEASRATDGRLCIDVDFR